jgi:hypothetical protein
MLPLPNVLIKKKAWWLTSVCHLQKNHHIPTDQYSRLLFLSVLPAPYLQLWHKTQPTLFTASSHQYSLNQYVQTKHCSLFSKWRAVWQSCIISTAKTFLLCTFNMKLHSKYKTVHFYLRICTEAMPITFLSTI